MKMIGFSVYAGENDFQIQLGVNINDFGIHSILHARNY